MNVLYIAQAGPDDQSTVHRMKSIARELDNRGHRTRIFFGNELSIGGYDANFIALRAVLHLYRKGDRYDVVVINRDGSPLGHLAAKICKRRSLPYIFDIDDALYDQRRIGDSVVPNPTRVFLDRMIANATAVTTGNEQISSYAGAHNDVVQTLPTAVDPSVFNPDVPPAREYADPVIGWMGVAYGHEQNLELLRDPLLELATDSEFVFRMVSAHDNDIVRETFAPLEAVARVDYGPERWLSMEEVAREMATFDVAALPLNPADEFMAGKSPIKVFEHLAMGIPVVASNALAYEDVLTHDRTGLLADTPADWTRALHRVLTDPGTADRLAENGRRMVLEEYTVDRFVDRFESLLESIDT